MGLLQRAVFGISFRRPEKGFAGISVALHLGPFLTVQAVWTIADIFNALMAIPNLIALVVLSGVVVTETRSYFNSPESRLRR